MRAPVVWLALSARGRCFYFHGSRTEIVGSGKWVVDEGGLDGESWEGDLVRDRVPGWLYRGT